MSPVHREGPEHSNELRTKDGRKVTVKLPPDFAKRIDPTHTETQARPKPEEPQDPRPSLMRNIPPYGGV